MPEIKINFREIKINDLEIGISKLKCYNNYILCMKRCKNCKYEMFDKPIKCAMCGCLEFDQVLEH